MRHPGIPMPHTKGFRSLGLNAISPRFIWKMVGPPGRRTWDQVELTWCRFDYLLIIQKSTQRLVGLFDMNRSPALEFERNGEGEQELAV